MTKLLWNKTQTQIVLDGMNGLSVVSKFQKIYTMSNKGKSAWNTPESL